SREHNRRPREDEGLARVEWRVLRGRRRHPSPGRHLPARLSRPGRARDRLVLPTCLGGSPPGGARAPDAHRAEPGGARDRPGDGAGDGADGDGTSAARAHARSASSHRRGAGAERSPPRRGGGTWARSPALTAVKADRPLWSHEGSIAAAVTAPRGRPTLAPAT